MRAASHQPIETDATVAIARASSAARAVTARLSSRWQIRSSLPSPRSVRTAAMLPRFGTALAGIDHHAGEPWRQRQRAERGLVGDAAVASMASSSSSSAPAREIRAAADRGRRAWPIGRAPLRKVERERDRRREFPAAYRLRANRSAARPIAGSRRRLGARAAAPLVGRRARDARFRAASGRHRVSAARGRPDPRQCARPRCQRGFQDFRHHCLRPGRGRWRGPAPARRAPYSATTSTMDRASFLQQRLGAADFAGAGQEHQREPQPARSARTASATWFRSAHADRGRDSGLDRRRGPR